MSDEKKSYSDIMKLTLSIIFASLLWYYVVTDQNPLITRSYDIPIKLLNMEYIEKNDLVLIQNPNSLKVTIKLKGYKDDLELVSGNSITASADLMGVKAKGELRSNISFSGIPDGITLVEQSASELILNLDRKVSGHLQITYKFKGKTPDGFAPVVNSIIPSGITVTGPEEDVTRAKAALVTIDVTGLANDVTKEQSVTIVDSEGKEIPELSIEPKSTKISLSLGAIKLVPILPQFVGKPADGYSILESGVYPKFISIAGKQENLNTVTEIKTEKISIKGIKERQEKSIKLIIPPGISLVENGTEIKTFVDVEKVVTKQIKTGIEIRNLGEGLAVEGISQEIVLTVVGPESLLENPSLPLKVYVDLSGLGEGEHTLTVHWDPQKDFKIISATPELINMKVKKIL